MVSKVIAYRFGEQVEHIVSNIREAERFKANLINKYKMPEKKIHFLQMKNILHVFYPKPIPIYEKWEDNKIGR
jgi:hypothetical protein